MIKATIDWGRMRAEVTGHAGYAELGQDIVCAGASILSYALMASLEDARQRGRTEANLKDDGAKMIMRAEPNLGNMQEIKSYFRLWRNGMRLLQDNYPENVEIKEV